MKTVNLSVFAKSFNLLLSMSETLTPKPVLDQNLQDFQLYI